MKETKYKYFINLTNGIEYLPIIYDKDYSFIRIQSTALEQHLWSNIILDLDYNFLMSLAVGENCVVVDYGANKEVPRAIYQGIPFLKYVLNRRWFGLETNAFVKGQNCRKYFSECYEKLSDKAKKKLDYFKPFLMTNVIDIWAIAQSTTHDGNKEFYSSVLRGVKEQ